MSTSTPESASTADSAASPDTSPAPDTALTADADPAVDAAASATADATPTADAALAADAAPTVEAVPAADAAPTADTSSTTDAADAPVVRALDVADSSRMRRAPRYGRFGLVGFLVGAVLSLTATFLPFGSSGLSRGDLFLLLLLSLGTAGIFVGLGWALVADRRSLRRRARG